MALDDVLDDGQAKPGAAGLAAAGRVHTIETLRDSLQMLARDAMTVIGDREDDPGTAP